MGQLFLGESQSRICQHMRAKFGRGPTVVSKGGGGTDTHIMKLVQVCQVQYCQQGVNNCGGDPVTQLIVNVYQMIKL